MPLASRVATARSLVSAVRIATRPGGPTIPERMGSVPRLVRATMAGEYRGTTVARLLLILAAAGYLISPVDLMPEALLGPLGLADDAMVLGWLAGQLVNETEDFLAWERGDEPDLGAGRASAQTVPGDVVR
jgi:uncharacterized membrane protein YkvA (DUF1232 family)